MLNAFLNIFIPIFIGYGLRQTKWFRRDFHPRATRFLVSFISPLVITLSFWGLHLEDFRLFYLPIIGLLIALFSFFPALVLGNFLKLNKSKLGIFIAAAMFANVGFYGGYIAFERFGQYGYNLVALYIVYFTPLYYSLGFIICEHFAQTSPDPNWAKRLYLLFRRDIVYRPILGILVGLLLAKWAPERPGVINNLVNYLIPAITWAFLCLAGFSIKFNRMRPHLGTALHLSAIKFVIPVLLTLIFIPIFGFAEPQFQVVRSVLILEAICPIGVSVVILPSLFNLDGDLANTIWLVTHVIGFFVILPFFYLFF